MIELMAGWFHVGYRNSLDNSWLQVVGAWLEAAQRLKVRQRLRCRQERFGRKSRSSQRKQDAFPCSLLRNACFPLVCNADVASRLLASLTQLLPSGHLQVMFQPTCKRWLSIAIFILNPAEVRATIPLISHASLWTCGTNF
jgi:hypothetical protein